MAVATGTHQYLTFTLENEQYAVDVAKVREVLEETPLTKIPRMPEFMKGVINIRGSVVPVIDLRLKFGMEEGEKTVDTAIIVMDINAEDTTITAGCLADSVQEVIDILPESIEGAPKLGTKVDTNFIQGMGKKDEQFIIILDIDKVFQQDELQAVEQGKRLADTPVAATAT